MIRTRSARNAITEYYEQCCDRFLALQRSGRRQGYNRLRPGRCFVNPNDAVRLARIFLLLCALLLTCTSEASWNLLMKQSSVITERQAVSRFFEDLPFAINYTQFVTPVINYQENSFQICFLFATIKDRL